MKKTSVALYHGWAFGPSFWNPLRRELGDSFEFHCEDRGYFGAEKSSASPASAEIVIVHSLGLHFVPPENLEAAEQVFVFGGFRFFHSPPSKLSNRLVRRMLNKISVAPHDVLSDFHRNSFTPADIGFEAPENVSVARLIEDLEWLDFHEMNLEPLRKVGRVAFFHGSEDKIVSVEKSEELRDAIPGSRFIRCSEAGHALPRTHPVFSVKQLNLKTGR